MDWKSNFTESEKELIFSIVRFSQQVGYEPESHQDIIRKMVSILDSAEEIINGRG